MPRAVRYVADQFDISARRAARTSARCHRGRRVRIAAPATDRRGLQAQLHRAPAPRLERLEACGTRTTARPRHPPCRRRRGRFDSQRCAALRALRLPSGHTAAAPAAPACPHRRVPSRRLRLDRVCADHLVEGDPACALPALARAGLPGLGFAHALGIDLCDGGCNAQLPLGGVARRATVQWVGATRTASRSSRLQRRNVQRRRPCWRNACRRFTTGPRWPPGPPSRPWPATQVRRPPLAISTVPVDQSRVIHALRSAGPLHAAGGGAVAHHLARQGRSSPSRRGRATANPAIEARLRAWDELSAGDRRRRTLRAGRRRFTPKRRQTVGSTSTGRCAWPRG